MGIWGTWVGRGVAVLCSILTIANGAYAAKVIYVDAGAGGANNGSSWTDAYHLLQDALAAANSAAKPVEVRVAQGAHRPDRGAGLVVGDRTATFRLTNGVAVMGGYAGTGYPDPNARDIAKYQAILSGDLKNDDALLLANHSENSYHVVTAIGVGNTAALDGFTVTAGYANGTSQAGRGGGMYIENASPTICNCILLANATVGTEGGGGIYILSGTPTLTDCMFFGNTAGIAGGGAIYNLGDARLTRCVLAGNKAGSTGGGLHNASHSAMLVNCLFSGNFAQQYGGGVYSTGSSKITLTNCTFAANLAVNGNALACDSWRKGSPSNITLTNCILHDGGSEIWNNDSSVLTAAYSDIQAGWPGTGNLVVDPCFAEPGHWIDKNDPNRAVEPNDPNASWSAGDYHLKSQAGRWRPTTQTWLLDQVTSLCIDAGRITDPVGLEPFPNGGIINMGAYGGTIEASKSYFGGAPCQAILAGDLNGDCKVDFLDYRLLSGHWLDDYREKVHVQWFGQGAVKIWTSKVVIYVDPYRLTTSPLDATLLLITHTHSDHYSAADIARVSTSATQLVGPQSVITAAGKGTLLLPGQTIDIGSVRITGVAAYNSNHPKSNNWLGFIVEILGKRIFCAGDTSLTTELKAVVGMDVAFLPIDGVYNMGPTVAAEATTYMQPKLAIPYHLGSADAQTFAKLAACPVKIMTVGEEIVF